MNGMNYFFTIVDNKTKDQYYARVYVTFSKQASVQEITKNGASIKKSADSQPKNNIDQLIAGGWQQVTTD